MLCTRRAHTVCARCMYQFQRPTHLFDNQVHVFPSCKRDCQCLLIVYRPCVFHGFLRASLSPSPDQMVIGCLPLSSPPPSVGSTRASRNQGTKEWLPIVCSNRLCSACKVHTWCARARVVQVNPQGLVVEPLVEESGLDNLVNARQMGIGCARPRAAHTLWDLVYCQAHRPSPPKRGLCSAVPPPVQAVHNICTCPHHMCTAHAPRFQSGSQGL